MGCVSRVDVLQHVVDNGIVNSGSQGQRIKWNAKRRAEVERHESGELIDVRRAKQLPSRSYQDNQGIFQFTRYLSGS